MLQRIGRYEILERIGRGGQGTVYRARDTTLDRVVAVKVIDQPVTDDPGYQEALQREARLAAGLTHPNIVTVHDFQVEDGNAYIVMEYAPDALDRHLQGGTRLPWQRAVEIAIQVAQGLQHAHDNGVVHRDIKPPNILLTEDGTVKVSDFGIARALASSTRSRTASLMGTPAYMSPEQWASGSLDGRLDQYALGIVLYEMLSGATPFQGESMEALFVHHRDSPLPPLLGRLGVPRAVEDVVRRAMAKLPEDRFADANAMAAVLGRVLTSARGREAQPVQTPGKETPSASPSRPDRTARRGPLTLLGILGRRGLAFGLLVAAGLASVLVVIAVGVSPDSPNTPQPRVVEVVKEHVVQVPVEVTKIVEVTKEAVVEKEGVKEVPVEVVKEVPIEAIAENKAIQENSMVVSPVLPAPTLRDSKIAFRLTTFQPGQIGDGIYVMNVDGTGQTRLTTGPRYDQEPTWSPDGAKIVFHSDLRPGDHDSPSEIYMMNVDGTGRMHVPNLGICPGGCWDPSWSPDGTKIAFVTNSGIHVMNVDGNGRMDVPDLGICPGGCRGSRLRPLR